MEEKKFGQGFLVGSLVGLGIGVAGTCVAAALMSDDETDPEIEDQEIVKTAEKAGESVSENAETEEESLTDE